MRLERGLEYAGPRGLGTEFRFYSKNNRESLEVCKQGNTIKLIYIFKRLF